MRVFRELGGGATREPTPERAREFREALEELGTTSIAQIHPALLANGREVVVKVRRPRVLEQVEVDLALLRSVARLAERGSDNEVRRKLPRCHWRPLAGIDTGAALPDLQRVALRYRVRLPTSFALVGKTLAQADSIAAHARSRARSGRPRRGGCAQRDRRRHRPRAAAEPRRRERVPGEI